MQFTEEQQAHINKLVGDARVKAREKAEADATAQAAKDKATADQAALVAQQEWKKLAEQHKARVDELEPLTKQVEGYEELVRGLLKDAVEKLGERAKTAIDGLPKSMTAIEKLNWLHKNEELFQADGPTGIGTPGKLSKPPGKKKNEPRRVTSL